MKTPERQPDNFALVSLLLTLNIFSTSLTTLLFFFFFFFHFEYTDLVLITEKF